MKKKHLPHQYCRILSFVRAFRRLLRGNRRINRSPRLFTTSWVTMVRHSSAIAVVADCPAVQPWHKGSMRLTRRTLGHDGVGDWRDMPLDLFHDINCMAPEMVIVHGTLSYGHRYRCQGCRVSASVCWFVRVSVPRISEWVADKFSIKFNLWVIALQIKTILVISEAIWIRLRPLRKKAISSSSSSSSFICSAITSKINVQRKVYMSKTCQAHMSTYDSL